MAGSNSQAIEETLPATRNENANAINNMAGNHFVVCCDFDSLLW